LEPIDFWWLHLDENKNLPNIEKLVLRLIIHKTHAAYDLNFWVLLNTLQIDVVGDQ